MSITEITLSSLLNYNVQAKYREIVRRFLSERYGIQSGALANNLVSQFATQVASNIKNSKALFNAIYNQLDEKAKTQETISDEVSDKLDKLVLDEIENGTIVLDETGKVITQDEILNFSVELAVDNVAELPDFDINNAGNFKVWISSQPITEIVNALHSGNYESLTERFGETLV